MKRLVLIAALIALTPVAAQAQGKQRPTGNNAPAAPVDDRQKRMAREEAAAKAAMERVPDSKEKYDPWKIGK